MSSTNITYYKLGLIGLALLRNWLTGKKSVSESLVDQAKQVIDDFQDPTQDFSGDGGPKQFDLASGYERWASNYDQMPNLLLDAEQPAVEKILSKLPAGKIADFACGTGRYSVLLNNLGHQVVGIDQSTSMIQVAKSKSSNIEFVESDITQVDCKDETFDHAICALALSHFEDLTDPIKEITRLVKPGGKIILSDIHPLIVTLGGHADFVTKNCDKGFIKNNIHLHSDYISQFNANHLEIIRCMEPKLKWNYLEVLGLI